MCYKGYNLSTRLLVYSFTKKIAWRFYIVAIVRHRGTVGAWRNRGYLRVLLIALVYFFPKQWFVRFIKRLLPKLSATRTLRLCRSLCLRHLREVVFMLSPPCSPPLCVPFIGSRFTLSLHISEEPNCSLTEVTEH